MFINWNVWDLILIRRTAIYFIFRGSCSDCTVGPCYMSIQHEVELPLLDRAGKDCTVGSRRSFWEAFFWLLFCFLILGTPISNGLVVQDNYNSLQQSPIPWDLLLLKFSPLPLPWKSPHPSLFNLGLLFSTAANRLAFWSCFPPFFSLSSVLSFH